MVFIQSILTIILFIGMFTGIIAGLQIQTIMFKIGGWEGYIKATFTPWGMVSFIKENWRELKTPYSVFYGSLLLTIVTIFLLLLTIMEHSC